MSLNPKVWGPHAWFIMYSVAFTYPNNPTNSDMDNVRNFYLSFGKVLPCMNCREHFAQNLIKYPLNNTVLNSPENLINWVINFNNEVNKITGNKKIITYDNIIKHYNKEYSEEPQINKRLYNDIVMLLLLPISIILIILINKKYIMSRN